MNLGLDFVESVCSEQGIQELEWIRQGKAKQMARQKDLRDRKIARDRRHEYLQELQLEIRTMKSELEHLRRENDLLRQESELLKFREDSLHFDGNGCISRNIASQTLSDTRSLSLRYAMFMLPRFSGTDPTEYTISWLKSLNRCTSAFGWSDSESLLAARLSLDGVARQWLVCQRRDLLTWKDFQRAFIGKFRKAETAAVQIYLTLSRRKKKTDENMEDYLREMEELGTSVNLDEKHIVEFMVNGLTGDLSLLRKSRTVKELRSRLKYWRAAKVSDDFKKLGTNNFIIEDKMMFMWLAYDYVMHFKTYARNTLFEAFLVVFLTALGLLCSNIFMIYYIYMRN